MTEDLGIVPYLPLWCQSEAKSSTPRRRKRRSGGGPRNRSRSKRNLEFVAVSCFLWASTTWHTLAFPQVSPLFHERKVGLSRRLPDRFPWSLSSSSHHLASAHEDHILASRIPRHVAFICDGNSRWAVQNNCPAAQGHRQGAERLVELLEALKEDGISYCTLYGFSTENWERPALEIAEIFQVMEQTARKILPRLIKEKSSIRIRILGDLDDERIPGGLRAILHELQKLTASNARLASADRTLTVCLAINYGGRQDILQASVKMAAAVRAGELSMGDLSEDTLSSFLSTSGIPDPDMVVRTSGEYRLSNFLLWNVAYSELYITDVLWPDFDADCWADALSWYRQRSRRFGSRREISGTKRKDTANASLVNGHHQSEGDGFSRR